jgi:glutamyl-tRNA synthetase
MSTADGRFAPSPTGPLHLGSLRTALAAWLFARSQGARFHLRVEDLDPQRSRLEHEVAQIADLRALGLDWDGPVLRQSGRISLYDVALSQLEASGRIYPCFCTRAEIREAASAPHGATPGKAAAMTGVGLAPGAYPGTCRLLSDSERGARIAQGHPFALRLQADSEQITFTDRLLGERSAAVDDFVVRRADGVPAYQLAVVVDDAAQKIGEVVRGADLAESTPRQILLCRLLGLPVPAYAHIPLVLGSDRARLAKRHGAVTLAERGETSERTLALLAHSLGLAIDRDEVHTPAELIGEFSPQRIPPEPIVL